MAESSSPVSSDLLQACTLLADSSGALVQKATSGEASIAEVFDVTWDSAARLFYSVVAEGDLHCKSHDREALATPRQVSRLHGAAIFGRSVLGRIDAGQ